MSTFYDVGGGLLVVAVFVFIVMIYSHIRNSVTGSPTAVKLGLRIKRYFYYLIYILIPSVCIYAFFFASNVDSKARIFLVMVVSLFSYQFYHEFTWVNSDWKGKVNNIYQTHYRSSKRGRGYYVEYIVFETDKGETYKRQTSYLHAFGIGDRVVKRRGEDYPDIDK